MLPPSPFCDRFGTNYAPSAAEIIEIERILKEPEKRLPVVAQAIARLRQEQWLLESFIKNHRRLIRNRTPIRRVPDDIFREIFVHSLPDDHLPVRSIWEAPLLFTRVCRTWREIAISTPPLWNKIHISLPFPTIPPINEAFRSRIKAREEGLKLWLSRSGRLPLTISFYAVMPGADFLARRSWAEDEHSLNLLELESLYVNFARTLLSCAPPTRWEDVTLVVPNCIRDVLGTYGFLRLDTLKRFKSVISPCHVDSHDTTLHPFERIFEHAKSLRVLCLDEAYSRLPIQWNGLTEIVLGPPARALDREWSRCISSSDALRVLCHTRVSLQRCTMSIQFSQDNILQDSSAPIAVLSHLRSLNLFFNYEATSLRLLEYGSASSQTKTFLDSISAPNLTHSTISLWSKRRKRRPFDESPFISFFRHSGPLMSHLQIHAVSSKGLAKLLQCTPLLTALEFELWPKQGIVDLVRALAPAQFNAPDSQLLCPLLDTVTFTHCSSEDASPLVTLAYARSSPPEGSHVQKLRKMISTFAEPVFGQQQVIKSVSETLRSRGVTNKWTMPPDTRGLVTDDSPMRGLPVQRMWTLDPWWED
ncbi:hypothetical protein VNI00_005934 [Paramarasmius palmivorus]|uniref:F-box domain-containing protein n=1 Tax=Paramarasmius palmivorus TaxID=297713 RepID=A0AAW0DE68_9AGAR